MVQKLLGIEGKGSPQNLIVFVGGAHGVGKDTVLDMLRRDPDWEKINIISMSDVVDDACREKYHKGIVELGSMTPELQGIQVDIVNEARKLEFTTTFLNGHYSFVYPDGRLIKHYNFYEDFMIKFDGLIVVTANPKTILARRVSDTAKKRKFDLGSIEREQEGELTEAKRIADLGNQEVFVIENVSLEETARGIKDVLSKLREIPH